MCDAVASNIMAWCNFCHQLVETPCSAANLRDCRRFQDRCAGHEAEIDELPEDADLETVMQHLLGKLAENEVATA